MSPSARGTASSIMLAILFLAGLSPLGINVAAVLVTGRHVEPAPWWVVFVGVVVSCVVANRADDMLGTSAAKLADSVKGWLPWRSGQPPGGV